MTSILILPDVMNFMIQPCLQLDENWPRAVWLDIKHHLEQKYKDHIHTFAFRTNIFIKLKKSQDDSNICSLT